jgi:hypothetical protein
MNNKPQASPRATVQPRGLEHLVADLVQDAQERGIQLQLKMARIEWLVLRRARVAAGDIWEAQERYRAAARQAEAWLTKLQNARAEAFRIWIAGGFHDQQS